MEPRIWWENFSKFQKNMSAWQSFLFTTNMNKSKRGELNANFLSFGGKEHY